MNDTQNTNKQNTENSLNNTSVRSDVLTDTDMIDKDSQDNSGTQVQNNNNIQDYNAIKYPNLKPYNPKYNNHLSTKEAQERGRKGGIKSGEVRKARKTMKETLESALMMELSTNKLEELGADISLMNGDNSVLSAIVASAIREAINGDIRSLQTIRDTIGEQPTIKQEITETITKEDKTLMDNLSKALIS